MGQGCLLDFAEIAIQRSLRLSGGQEEANDMKKKNWLYLVLILVCVGVFVGYRLLDAARTDTNPPEIQVSQEQLTLSVEDPKEMLLQGVTAKDRRDGDVTSTLVVERVMLTDKDGTLRVRYAAFDRAGNVSKADREARYSDYASPRFSLNRALVFTEGASVDPMGAIGVTDLLDGDISHLIRATPLDSTSIANKGTHNVKFRVSNSLGDTVELVLPVEVVASGDYNAQLYLKEYLVYLKVNDNFRSLDYLDRLAVGREEISLSGGMPTGFRLSTDGIVDTSTPGVYSVAYTVSQIMVEESDTVVRGYTRLIVVVEG